MASSTPGGTSPPRLLILQFESEGDGLADGLGARLTMYCPWQTLTAGASEVMSVRPVSPTWCLWGPSLIEARSLQLLAAVPRVLEQRQGV